VLRRIAACMLVLATACMEPSVALVSPDGETPSVDDIVVTSDGAVLIKEGGPAGDATIEAGPAPFTGYSGYTQGAGHMLYVDACSGGTVVTVTDGGAPVKDVTNIPIGFEFWIYHYPSATRFGAPSTINIAWNGQLTFGESPLSVLRPVRPWPDRSLSNPSPRNAFVPFWDSLTYAAGGQLCYLTIGTEPNRRFVVEWRNMTFAEAPDEGALLNFEAFLFESTGEIDTVYHSMLDATGSARTHRAEGSEALVGMQDSTKTHATATFNLAQYGTGTTYSYMPTP
jgi:hypothetical protein